MPDPRVWRTGDAVRIECRGTQVEGVVRLASGNGVSLMLAFDAMLVGRAGMMPVLQGPDRVFRSIITQDPITLSPGGLQDAQ